MQVIIPAFVTQDPRIADVRQRTWRPAVTDLVPLRYHIGAWHPRHQTIMRLYLLCK